MTADRDAADDRGVIAREARLFFAALRRSVPVGLARSSEADPQRPDGSLKYSPLVGALIGTVAAFALMAAAAIFPEPVPVAIAITVAVMLTGAKREDGLARAADALVAGGITKDERRAIFNDRYVGRYGATAIVILFGLKAAALLGMDPLSAAKALIAAHAAAALARVIVMGLSPCSEQQAEAGSAPPATRIASAELLLAALFGLLPAALLLWPAAATISVAAASATTVALALLCSKRIGGTTGATLGACELIFETVFLLFAAAIISGPG